MILHFMRMRRNVNQNVFNDRKNVSATPARRGEHTFLSGCWWEAIHNVGGVGRLVDDGPLVPLHDVLQLRDENLLHLLVQEDHRPHEAVVLHQRPLDLHEHLHVAIDTRRRLEVEAPPGVQRNTCQRQGYNYPLVRTHKVHCYLTGVATYTFLVLKQIGLLT